MPDFDTRRPQEPDEPNGLRSRSLTNRVRRVLLRVALAAGAGLVIAVVYFSALYTYSRYATAASEYRSLLLLYSHIPPSLERAANHWGLSVYVTVTLGLVSCLLPPLALGAKWGGGHALISAGLYALGFVALLVGFFAVWPWSVGMVWYLLALMAPVGTSALASLIAVQGEDRMVSRILPITLITALTMCCALSFAFWATVELGGGWRSDLDWQTLPIPMVIAAASSWLVVPAIVASLRSG